MTKMEKIFALWKVTGVSMRECKEAIEFVSQHSNQPITAYSYLYAKLLVGVRPLTIENLIIYSKGCKDPWENEDGSEIN